ncbi:hypothetical protein GCM10010483_09510 [Actinokineospora diospyrosa]
MALVGGDGGGLGHLEHVELVVGDAAALGGGDLGGADVHAPVQLQGVGVDDLAAEVFGEVVAEFGLAGRGGADDGDGTRHAGSQVAKW